jgi:hypothetical protein
MDNSSDIARSAVNSPRAVLSASENKTRAKGGTVGDGTGGGGEGGGSWYEALVSAWGSALDGQAAKIEGLSKQLEGAGKTIEQGLAPDATEEQKAAGKLAEKTDEPSVLIKLTGASQKFGFMSASASTSINAVGEAEAALGRKG